MFPAGKVSMLKKIALAYATTALLVGSAALNVVQAHIVKSYTQPAPLQPARGSVAPPLAVRSRDGRPVEIRFEGRPTVLYYFSPSCGWCEKNWPSVNALAAAVQGRYRFIGLSASADLTAFLKNHKVSFDLYTDVTAEAIRQYHLGGTPRTVVVSSEGRIEHIWDGAYVASQQHEVEREFGVILPALASTAVKKAP